MRAAAGSARTAPLTLRRARELSRPFPCLIRKRHASTLAPEDRPMPKPKLNQIIAVAAGRKADVAKTVTELYHVIQKEGLFDGISRTYKPRAEDGEALPSESKHVQKKVKDLIKEATDAWTELFDVTLTQDL